MLSVVREVNAPLECLNSQNGKSPLPGGQARRNKRLGSWGPLVIAPPLAASLLAPLRCAAPCQSRSRAPSPGRFPSEADIDGAALASRGVKNLLRFLDH